MAKLAKDAGARMAAPLVAASLVGLPTVMLGDWRVGLAAAVTAAILTRLSQALAAPAPVPVRVKSSRRR